MKRVVPLHLCLLKRDPTLDLAEHVLPSMIHEFARTSLPSLPPSPPKNDHQHPPTHLKETTYIMAKKRKDKVPYPGTKGEKSTSFFTRKKWKSIMQYNLLELAGRGLDPRGAQVVGTALMKNTYVTKLDLCNNGLGNDGTVLLADVMRANTHINWLNLSHNGITDIGGIALASAFIPNVSPSGQPGQWNRNIMTIILMGNELSDDTLLAFSNAAACHRDLTRVDLSWNRVGPQGTKCLLRCFQRNPLCNFTLSANSIGDIGTAHLCDALIRHGSRTWTTLNLFRNDISHRGAAAIGQLLSRTDMILDVNLRSNTLGARGVQELRGFLTSAGATITVRSLNLADNMIGDEGARDVAGIIEADLPHLLRLDISDNNFTDAGALIIARALRTNTRLLQVNCRENTFGAKSVAAVADLVRGTQSLKSLNLANCIESADQRRSVTLAVGEADGVHVEMGEQGGMDANGGDAVAKMAEFLQIQADQEAAKAKEATLKKKMSRSRSAKSA